VKPKIVACCGHQEKDREGGETQRLKGKLRQTAIACIADEQAHQRGNVSARVKLIDGEHAMH
jgi:hypothetical protein